MVAWDTVNLSTLLGFAKKLVMPGEDTLIRWWQGKQTERVKPINYPCLTPCPTGLPSQVACSETDGDTQ